MGVWKAACLFVLLALSGRAEAPGEGPVAQRRARLLGLCFRHQAELDRIEEDLRRVEATLAKARELRSRAQAAHQAEAERLADQAVTRAGAAKADHLARQRAVAVSLAKTQAQLALPDDQILALALPDGAEEGRVREALQREREAHDRDRTGWMRPYQALVREGASPAAAQRSRALASTLLGSPVPPPVKVWPQLAPGDVLLVDPDVDLGRALRRAEAFADSLLSGPDRQATACHTLVFLKEAHGQRFFLDNQMGEGPRIITEAAFLERYGHRFLSKAAYARRDAEGIYVAERLDPNHAQALWDAAMAAHQKGNQQRIVVRDPFGRDRVVGSGYGAFGEDMVCSETSRWALMRAGRPVAEARSGLKRILGIQFGPADFFDPSQPFLITPLGRGLAP